MPRLDQLLVERGFYATRARARDAVLRGTVTVEGRAAAKPAMGVPGDAHIEVADEARRYVSRAALKLAHGLDIFGVSPAGLDALDLGASTGGFTQVLLERGARQVTAVDVGQGQMAAEVANDAQVNLLEGLNARDLSTAQVSDPIDFITADLSFISLKLALGPALALARPGAVLVALIKPQFEAGLERLGKGGVVRDPAVHQAVCNDIRHWLEREMGWRVLGIEPSPILGGDGNAEFLVAARKA